MIRYIVRPWVRDYLDRAKAQRLRDEYEFRDRLREAKRCPIAVAAVNEQGVGE